MENINQIIKAHMTYGTLTNDKVSKVRLEQVDELADMLVKEYSNPGSRRWYCGVINKYGVAKVLEWNGRASEGKRPGRLFSSYVNQAGGYRRAS